MDLKDIIAERVLIHSAAKSLALDPSIDDQVSKQCAAVALVSQDPLHWEFVVAASGFMQGRGETGSITIPRILDVIREERSQATIYFDAVATMPIDQVLSAGLEVERLVAPIQVNVMAAISDAVDCVNECQNEPESKRDQCCLDCFLGKRVK